MNKRFDPHFTPNITKTETIVGWLYTPAHMFVMPLLLSLVVYGLWPDMTDIQGNLLYYGVGMVIVLPVFFKMLRREFDRLYDRPLHCLSTLFWGYCIWYGLSLILSVFMTLSGWLEDSPNDVAIDEMAQGAYNLTMLISVILAPILEEILFRGVVFQSIRKKSRLLAYVVNILLFGFYHIWQYVLVYGDLSYLLFIVQYIPVTFALIWVYEYSGSLWTAIFFHMSNNFLAMQILQMM